MENRSVILLENPKSRKRVGEPITIGVPFEKGELWEPQEICLKNDQGKSIPFQANPLIFWPDQSFKWVLFDFFVFFQEGASNLLYSFEIQKDRNADSLPGIVVEQKLDNWSVETGDRLFQLATKEFKFTAKDANQSSNAVISELKLSDSNDMHYTPFIDNMQLELKGKIRSTVKVDGHFSRKGITLCNFCARLHFYQGKSLVKLDLTVKNENAAVHENGLWDLGDKGSVLIREMAMELKLAHGQFEEVKFKTNSNGSFEVPKDAVLIYQDSSGGKNWQSPNHKNRNNSIKNQFAGYKVIEKNGNVIQTGLRATPTVLIGDKQFVFSGTVKNFWQNCPKSIRVGREKIEFSLFPKEYDDFHELQGGEQKTHSLVFNFNSKDSCLDWIHEPIQSSLKPEYYLDSQAFPYLSLPHQKDKAFQDFLTPGVKGSGSFTERREIIDQFGWRNFGELYADHESVGSKEDSVFVSHYNNQYDPIYGFLRQFLSTNNYLWRELADDLAHHVTDIDIYRTEKDREEYNGGMFWHTDHYLEAGLSTHRTFSKKHLTKKKNTGGGPACEHVYSTGLFFHYLITGEEASREAVLGLAEWAQNWANGPSTVLGTLNKARQSLPVLKGLIKGEQIFKHKHPLSRGSGNVINTLLDAYYLTQEREYISVVQKIIRETIAPEEDVLKRDLLNSEVAWSYTVFLQALGKYLDLKMELNELDDDFYYARSSLLYYAEWMLNNECPYLDKLEKLEFPNETWVAQEIRKVNVFLFAFKYSEAPLKESFLEQSEYFYQYLVKQLDTFETKALTRPIVILLQNEGMRDFFKVFKSGDKTRFKSQAYLPPDSLSLRVYFVRLVADLFSSFIKIDLKNEISWFRNRFL